MLPLTCTVRITVENTLTSISCKSACGKIDQIPTSQWDIISLISTVSPSFRMKDVQLSLNVAVSIGNSSVWRWQSSLCSALSLFSSIQIKSVRFRKVTKGLVKPQKLLLRAMAQFIPLDTAYFTSVYGHQQVPLPS